MSSLPSPTTFPVGWRWLGRAPIAYLTLRNRWRSWLRERRRLRVLDETIQTLRQQQQKCRDLGLLDIERVYNVALYLLLIDRDGASIRGEMVSGFDVKRLRLAARQQALLIYEACDDLTQMLGKTFRHSLAQLGLRETSLQKFNSILKQLHTFKRVNHSFLYNDIRNIGAGHRAKDALEFLRRTEAINPLDVFKLGGEFFDIVRLVLDFLLETMVYCGQPANIMRQLSQSKKFLATSPSSDSSGAASQG